MQYLQLKTTLLWIFWGTAMKFTLPRHFIDPLFIPIIEREIKRQDFQVLKASAKLLQQLKTLCKEVEDKGIPSNLVLKKLPGKLGHGIFLHPDAAPIKKDTLIGPYSGILSIVPQNTSNDSAFTFSPLTDVKLTKNEQKMFDPESVFRPNRLYCLDIEALHEGNYIRFVNHSYKPNVAAHIYSVKKNSLGVKEAVLEVWYMACKTIKPGEQLLVNYEGDDGSYWENLGIKPIEITPQTYTLDSKLRLITKN